MLQWTFDIIYNMIACVYVYANIRLETILTRLVTKRNL